MFRHSIRYKNKTDKKGKKTNKNNKNLTKQQNTQSKIKEKLWLHPCTFG